MQSNNVNRNSLSRPTVITDPKEWRMLLQQLAEDTLQSLPQATVLDAGCGSRCRVNFPEHVHLVGVDNCEPAIAQNTQVREAIIGDIQTFSLPAARFDLITCIDVLEHVPCPEKALENLWRALKPGGVLIIRAPYLYSVKGLITKYTPHWVHVAFRKYIVREPHAGRPGYPPFKTFLKAGMTPQAITQRIEQAHGIVTRLYFRSGDNPYQLRQKSAAAHMLFRALIAIVRLLTLGRFREYSDYLLVATKQEANQTAERT